MLFRLFSHSQPAEAGPVRLIEHRNNQPNLVALINHYLATIEVPHEDIPQLGFSIPFAEEVADAAPPNPAWERPRL